MSNLAKLGYVLVGMGIGVIGTVIFYEKRKNEVLDVEEFIPEEDEENEHTGEAELGDDISNSNTDGSKDSEGNTPEYEEDFGKASYERGLEERRKEFEKFRADGNPNMATRYSRMYGQMTDHLGYTDEESNEGRRQPDIFDADECPADDEPEDYGDDYDYDLDLPRERVEPYIEIYADENPQDFVSLVYYAGDDSLADDREQLIPNASEVVGNVALERLVQGGPGVTDGIIYVRNVKTHINYEVSLIGGSYSETVLGIFDSRHRMNGDNDDVGRGTK